MVAPSEGPADPLGALPRAPECAGRGGRLARKKAAPAKDHASPREKTGSGPAAV